MGKLGRFACIFVPYALTLMAMVLMIIVAVSGRATGSGLLTELFAWKIDFSQLSIPANPNAIGQALQRGSNAGKILKYYRVNVFNYCSSNSTADSVDYCSGRQTGFVFDFVDQWGLAPSYNGQTVSGSALDDEVKNIFGQAFLDTMNAYRSASKWVTIAFQVALWTAVGTAIAAILALFSRWGSFITWVLSIASSLFSFGAAVTATILYGAAVGALKTAFDTYKVRTDLGTKFLAYIWVSTALSIAATLFWLFSICCCSGKSNPHHKDNKGGLLQGEASHDPYAGRGMKVEQTGGYQRVSSPYATTDRMPLNQYPAPAPMGGQQHLGTDGYEPYRYQR
ncbi:hypothetical protein AMS68_002688 [Peltaster fructicola]|uniref:Integral membrane protein n=1 Tax=Peltaster fructicola TaxID=286661 RepID=A0A6H0XR92_9PEZI|nr:hypothetical protein AMS68_002688 [Peltaster fructicola]